MVKAVDCKSIGQPALVRIQSTSIFYNLKKKNFLKLKKIIPFFKISKQIKFSFFFLFFIKKKIFFKCTNDFFFFYNNFFTFFLKKIISIFFIYKNDLLFITDDFFKKFSNIEELNIFVSKKNYFFCKKLSLNLKSNFFFNKKKFFFFFLSNLSLSNLSSYFFFFNKNSGLLLFSSRPDTYQLYLPIILDYQFSLFFYKFFFFKNLMHTIEC